MQSPIQNDASRTMIVCVDSYLQGVLCGCVYPCAQEGEGYEFRSLVQLIVGIESILDSANFPQSFNAVRNFFLTPKLSLKGAEGREIRRGYCATFVVKILFRQHSSWQGTLAWSEKRQEKPFRSVLELILLMNSALNGSGESQPAQENR